MRSVSSAICTSGEPVSLLDLPKRFVASCLASLLRAMSLLLSIVADDPARRARKTRTAESRSPPGYQPGALTAPAPVAGACSGALRGPDGGDVPGDLGHQLGLARERRLVAQPLPQ